MRIPRSTLLLGCLLSLNPLLCLNADLAKDALDKFGIKKLVPTITDGREWFSTWDNGHTRTFTGIDPNDAWYDADHGNATYKIDGKGLLIVSGSMPRMYVHDPEKKRSWKHGLECTVYAMRVADSNTAYAGVEFMVRTNHGTTGNETVDLGDTRGIAARMRNDGKVVMHLSRTDTDLGGLGRTVLTQVRG